ncbi:MAG TPA: hypothetical protein VHP37_28015 [Burkholderiales bacterium]|nr:hypothetical protein [Burkholderiales bacterium]
MSSKADAPLIAGTLECYVFLSQQTIGMTVLKFVKELQNAMPTIAAMLPELPALAEQAKDLWPQLPEHIQVELQAVATKIAGTSVSFDEGGILERFCLETFVTRQTDAFESYLSQIVERCLRSHPGALSDSQISIRELQECGSIDEAVARRIEMKVRELSLGGLGSVVEFLRKQFGISIDHKAASFAIVFEAIEVRHLIVHRDGKIDRPFVAKTGRNDLSLGQPFPLTWKFVLRTLGAFSDVAKNIDAAVIQTLRITQ